MFGKRRELPPPEVAKLEEGDTALPAPPVPTRGRPAYFGQGFKAEGTIQFDGQFDLDGHFIGDIRTARLIIGPTGCCEGNVVCDSLVIKGQLAGTALCRELEVHTGAQLTADVTYAEIRVTPRARLTGRLLHRPR